MGNHTPGPWFLISNDGADFTAISTKPTLPDGSDIDFDNEVLGTSEWLRWSEDDARLIAAAPELLEAAKAFVAPFERVEVVPDGAIAKARAAIAKATQP